jgi:hypothetical protein
VGTEGSAWIDSYSAGYCVDQWIFLKKNSTMSIEVACGIGMCSGLFGRPEMDLRCLPTDTVFLVFRFGPVERLQHFLFWVLWSPAVVWVCGFIPAACLPPWQ